MLTAHDVIVSPSPMAHIKDDQAMLHPICVHGSEDGEGWTASPDPWATWASLHPDIPRCLSCVNLDDPLSR